MKNSNNNISINASLHSTKTLLNPCVSFQFSQEVSSGLGVNLESLLMVSGIFAFHLDNLLGTFGLPWAPLGPSLGVLKAKPKQWETRNVSTLQKLARF